jgi:hypothetical protein
MQRTPILGLVTQTLEGRAVAQAVSRRLVNADARVRFQSSPCGIFGVGSGTGRDVSQASSVFAFQYYSTIAPYLLAHLSRTQYNLSNRQLR